MAGIGGVDVITIGFDDGLLGGTTFKRWASNINMSKQTVLTQYFWNVEETRRRTRPCEEIDLER